MRVRLEVWKDKESLKKKKKGRRRGRKEKEGRKVEEDEQRDFGTWNGSEFKLPWPGSIELEPIFLTKSECVVASLPLSARSCLLARPPCLQVPQHRQGGGEGPSLYDYALHDPDDERRHLGPTIHIACQPTTLVSSPSPPTPTSSPCRGVRRPGCLSGAIMAKTKHGLENA